MKIVFYSGGKETTLDIDPNNSHLKIIIDEEEMNQQGMDRFETKLFDIEIINSLKDRLCRFFWLAQVNAGRPSLRFKTPVKTQNKQKTRETHITGRYLIEQKDKAADR